MIRPKFPVITALGTAVAALIFTGCEKPQIRVYTVAKDAAPAAAPAPDPHSAPMAGAEDRPTSPPQPRPQVAYTAPAGWQEGGAKPPSLVNFNIKTDQGLATVNITPLNGMQGNEAAIVNLWRSQVNQPVLKDDEIQAAFKPVEIGGDKGQLFEVTGAHESKSLRIVTAFAHRGGQTWFYKLQGDEAVVAAQMPAFLEFLKTIKIKEGADATAAADASTPAAGPSSTPAPVTAMVAPEGWQSLPPGPMQHAKFAVKAGEAKADVSVSVFPSDTGGTLENVNRWRRQLGMAAVDQAGLQECITPLEGASIKDAPGAVLADLTHENRRMLGAIVPRDGKWWFYKMMGDVAAVSAERDNFIHFVKTQP